LEDYNEYCIRYSNYWDFKEVLLSYLAKDVIGLLEIAEICSFSDSLLCQLIITVKLMLIVLARYATPKV
jgi:hypothetical protein